MLLLHNVYHLSTDKRAVRNILPVKRKWRGKNGRRVIESLRMSAIYI